MRLFAALAPSALVIVAGAAMALPTHQVEISYFTDASFRQDAGFEVRPTCSGTPSRLSGRRTRFAVRVTERCHGGGPSEVACYFDGRLTTCPPNICDSTLSGC